MASPSRPTVTRRPSLLPAFEPLSSSPGLPRPQKRKFEEDTTRTYYPTPVPTSSTGILPSSPNARLTRPGLLRTVSSLSERAPLGAVPVVELHASGEPVLMGRSSNSSDYQLSANRLISRVHVRASYHVPDETCPAGRVVVTCLGWNGCRIHYQGEVTELQKGESFASEKRDAQIMVDVQETRVLLAWPKAEERTRAAWNSESPIREAESRLPSSPPSLHHRLQSPVSPTPGNQLDQTFLSTFIGSQSNEPHDDGNVQVYEDSDSPDDLPRESTPVPVKAEPKQTPLSSPSKVLKGSSSSLSEPEELSEHDEENDPIVHSFGPFGSNLLSRFESIKSSSPQRPRKPIRGTFSSPRRNEYPVSSSPPPPSSPRDATISPMKPTMRHIEVSPIKNHVINQLAFSRIHSLPLSTIYNNLPASMKVVASDPEALTNDELKQLLDETPCVGEIAREGKDAAGKPLENEFYYVPEMDEDEPRRTAVTIGKPGMRAVRKQHKQYFWKKPRH